MIHMLTFRRPCQTRVLEPVYYNSSVSIPVAVITPVQHGQQQQERVSNLYEYTTVGDRENNQYDIPSSPVYASHDMFPTSEIVLGDVEDSDIIVDNSVYTTDFDVSTNNSMQDGVDDETTIADSHVYCTEDEHVYDKNVDDDDVTIIDNSLYSQDIEECLTDDITLVNNDVYGQSGDN